MKKSIFLLFPLLILSTTSCNYEPTIYFNQEDKEAHKVSEISGYNELTIFEKGSSLTLENQAVKLVLDRSSGAIQTLANKEVGVYLLKDSPSSTPLMIEYLDGRYAYTPHTTSYTISKTSDYVSATYTWGYSQNLEIISTISLGKNSNEVEFSLDIKNNRQSDSLYYVEYPYLNNISRLYSSEKDKFFHTYANGYVFDDPCKNFNRNDFNGIKWYMGLYPYGFGSTMQYMSYYVEQYGGFHFQTYDKGYTIKSFTATGMGNDTLHMGIRHYLDDISSGDKSFYKIGISNLVKGNFEESAEKYYEFAKETPWAQKQGKLEATNSYLKDFVEDTTLVNFAPHVGLSSKSWQDWENIYDVLKEAQKGGKIFNIIGNDWQRLHSISYMNGEMDTMFPAVVDEEMWAQMQESDYTAFFEFNNMYNTKAASEEDYDFRRGQSTKDRYLNPQILGDTVNDSISWYYMCPEDSWYNFGLEKSNIFVNDYNVDFLYHDCGYCVAPRTCFDTSHSHGTRVNIIPDEIAFLDKLTRDTGKIVGEELISEVFVGTVGYYQARANAGPMGFMDINDIRVVVEDNTATKVSAFDYVYHGYGIVRTDGFMKPIKESGNLFYYIMGFTALEGGIPQLNYEYLKASFNSHEIVEDYMNYLSKLAEIKLNEGNKYLSYGKMKKAVDVGAGKIQYSYLNTSTSSADIVFSGKYNVNKVVSSAYEYNGTIGLFFSNITAEDINANFVINAKKYYGIETGKVYLGDKVIADVKDGIAKVSLDLLSRDVTLLTIR